MIKLKPCPFCGGEARILHNYAGGEWSYAECKVCRCSTEKFMKSFAVASDEQAIEAWNRRITDAN